MTLPKLPFYPRLTLQIVIIFSIVMLASLIPDNYHSIFGDYFCSGRIWTEPLPGSTTGVGHYIGCDIGLDAHNPTWHWGYRHWVWLTMGFCLFVVQCFRIGEFINNKNK